MTQSKYSYDDCARDSGTKNQDDSYQYPNELASSLRTGMSDTAHVLNKLLDNYIFGMNTGIWNRVLPMGENTWENIC